MKKMKPWDEFLKSQEKILGVDAIDKWARTLKVVDFDAANLYLEARDSFQIHWFEEHLRSQIVKFFKNNNGRAIKVHLAGQEGPKKKKWQPVFNLAADYVNPRMTFDSYFAGEANQTHLTLFREVVEKGGFNPIYLYGPEGSGKTHLLMAAANLHPGKKCFYVTTDTLTQHIVAAIRNGGMKRLRQLYREQDVLLLDNIEELANRNATQEEFFHTFNALHVGGKQIILAGKDVPEKLSGIEPRLTSRFEWGLVLSLQSLPYQDRLAWVQEKSPDVAQDIQHYLAREFESMRGLIAAVGISKGKPLSIVQKSVAPLLEEQRKKAITSEKIVKHVAEIFGIRAADILGKAQTQEFSVPRQIAMYLCRTHLKQSFLKIGEFFSRDHSTVMTSVKSIEKKIGEQDNVVLSALNQLRF
jgi:chromosomal replication initiator protein